MITKWLRMIQYYDDDDIKMMDGDDHPFKHVQETHTPHAACSGNFLILLLHMVCSREFSTKHFVAINASKSVISSMSLPNVPCKSNICPHGLVTIWAGKDISNLWVYINFANKQLMTSLRGLENLGQIWCVRYVQWSALYEKWSALYVKSGTWCVRYVQWCVRYVHFTLISVGRYIGC